MVNIGRRMLGNPRRRFTVGMDVGKRQQDIGRQVDGGATVVGSQVVRPAEEFTLMTLAVLKILLGGLFPAPASTQR
jgi:hypothetical protein